MIRTLYFKEGYHMLTVEHLILNPMQIGTIFSKDNVLMCEHWLKFYADDETLEEVLRHCEALGFDAVRKAPDEIWLLI